MPEIKVESITGTIKTTDNRVRSFTIFKDAGWQQWGEAPEYLGNTVEILEAMAQAAAEHMVSDSDEEDEDDAQADGA
jgi:hypothetical protein